MPDQSGSRQNVSHLLKLFQSDIIEAKKTCFDKSKLVHLRPNIVPIENMYDKLLELHVGTGYGCRDQVEAEINGKYVFITRKATEIFMFRYL